MFLFLKDLGRNNCSSFLDKFLTATVMALDLCKSVVYGLIYIRPRFGTLRLFFLRFYQSEGLQIILEVCSHKLTDECQYDILFIYTELIFRCGA